VVHRRAVAATVAGSVDLVAIAGHRHDRGPHAARPHEVHDRSVERWETEIVRTIALPHRDGEAVRWKDLEAGLPAGSGPGPDLDHDGLVACELGLGREDRRVPVRLERAVP